MRLTPITDWISEHPSVELVTAAILTGVHAMFAWHSFEWIARRMGEPGRLSAYEAGAAVLAIVGGMSAVAISVYLGATGARAAAAKQHHIQALRRTWRSAFVGIVLAAGLCVVAIIVDTTASNAAALVIYEFSILLALGRFVRLAWLFDRLLLITDRDATDLPRAPAPQLSQRWRDAG
jgi:hypothetical protein